MHFCIETVLNALERHGIVIPSRCRVGQCSACTTEVLRGQVFVSPTARVCEAFHDANYIHACVTYPIDDLSIRI